MIADGRDAAGMPTRVRVDSDMGKPELDIDSVQEWIIQQACKEARAEDLKVKIQFADQVSIEVPITPTVLASLFGVATFVLLGVVSFQWRLVRRLRLERTQNSGSAEAREAPVLPLSSTVVQTV